MEYGEHFIPVRRQTVIPQSDEAALKRLADEPYASSHYQSLRDQGASIEAAWNAIWSMLELTTSDIEHLLIVVVGYMEKSKERLPESWGQTYEKIRAFHYDAFPIAETYVLTKIAKEDATQESEQAE